MGSSGLDLRYTWSLYIRSNVTVRIFLSGISSGRGARTNIPNMLCHEGF